MTEAMLDLLRDQPQATLGAASTLVRGAALTCRRGEVAGLLGDASGRPALLRQCLGIMSGYPLATLGTDPAFARQAFGPRVRALADEQLEGQGR